MSTLCFAIFDATSCRGRSSAHSLRVISILMHLIMVDYCRAVVGPLDTSACRCYLLTAVATKYSTPCFNKTQVTHA